MEELKFHGRLKKLIHEYILLTYKQTNKYPSEEKFGLISQDRRASVSIMLNYIEGYARMKPLIVINFFETSYASLKESIYCKYLGTELGYIDKVEYHQALALKEEIGAMLYKTIEGLKNKNN